MTLVEVDNLSCSFGGVKAIDGLSFAVEEGEIFGLVGPDGAGKTTCLRVLAGLVEPGGGKAEVLGRDVARDPEAIKNEIGYMSQPAGLYDDLTVKENIEFYAALYQVPPGEYDRRMKRLLDFSGLAPFTGRLFRNLSGGMKQKVGLACVLIHTPRILFLDEPTNGVDPISRRDFWKILYELRREKVTIVVATTYLDEADRCHRVALLERGRARLVMEPLAMRSLMPGALFQLTVTGRRAALKTLKTMPQVLSPYIFGPGIHFSFTGDSDLTRVTEALTSAGLEVLQVRQIHPSLEDVYLSLVAESGGEAV